MAAFVDGHDLGSLFRRKDQANEVDSDDDIAKIDIGPLVGRKRGFRTKERIPYSGGLGGMQMVADEDVLGNGKGFVWDGRRYKEGVPPSSPTLPFSPGPTKRGKERSSAVDEDADMIDAPTGVGDGLALGQHPSLFATFLRSLSSHHLQANDPTTIISLCRHQRHRPKPLTTLRRSPDRQIHQTVVVMETPSSMKQKNECPQKCGKNGCIANWRRGRNL